MVILNEVKDLLFPLLCKEGLGEVEASWRFPPNLYKLFSVGWSWAGRHRT